ncbi:MAG TPA: transglutaminase-like domain-containing protein [Rhizomicrobium sp.]|nr:transglutaminase-like domain-containing protein [Rhizomicrobium sp.]
MPDALKDPANYLKALGEAGDGPHNIAEAALALSLLDHPRVSPAPYRAHLEQMAHFAKDDSRAAHTAEDVARALARLMTDRYGYEGDHLTYDDPQNADLLSVIDRRRGLPVTLGILYIHAARAAGCTAEGLKSPGHFLMRLTFRNSEALIDPFSGGMMLAHEMGAAPPRMGALPAHGPQTTDSVSDTEILLRLQNNIRQRAAQAGDLKRVLDLAQRMVRLGPTRTDLWLDLARLQEQAGSLGAAKGAYEAALVLTKPGDALRNETALALHALKRKLN